MPRPNYWMLLTLTSCLLLGLAGCAKPVKKVAIQGAITQNGKPVTTSSRGFVQVIFYPGDATVQNATSVPAVVDSQKGTYEVSAIPVGKYKVAVQQLDPAPATDKLKGAFNATNTKIVRDITADGKVDIDLAQP
jgi:hypothetical protein